MNDAQTCIVRVLGRRRRIGTPTAGAIDEVAPVVGEPGLIMRPGAIDVAAGEPLYVRGWAIDETRRALGWDIRFEIDGNEAKAQIRSGQPRPDIVRAYGSPHLLASGFEAVVSTLGLCVGPHELGVRVTVGRRGAAFATIPVRTRFFVHDVSFTALAPPLCRRWARWFKLDSIPPAASGSILAVSGWAIDRSRLFSAIAGRIDAGPWQAGWTRVDRPDLAARAGRRRRLGGFGLRIPLAAITPGRHNLEIAARTADGRWAALYARSILVGAAGATLQPYLRRLTDGGSAVITRIGGEQLPALRACRITAGTTISLAGTLRRSSPVGAPATIIVQRSDGHEVRIDAWSAPADDPTVVQFEATLGRAVLSPGVYRIAVEAPDPTQRFIGRADTQWTLQVDADPDDTTAAASGIARMTASSTIATS